MAGIAAEQGNAYAMADMGKMYAQGIFVEADQTKAQEWYEKALKAMLVVEGRKENTFCYGDWKNFGHHGAQGWYVG